MSLPISFAATEIIRAWKHPDKVTTREGGRTGFDVSEQFSDFIFNNSFEKYYKHLPSFLRISPPTQRRISDCIYSYALFFNSLSIFSTFYPIFFFLTYFRRLQFFIKRNLKYLLTRFADFLLVFSFHFETSFSVSFICVTIIIILFLCLKNNFKSTNISLPTYNKTSKEYNLPVLKQKVLRNIVLYQKNQTPRIYGSSTFMMLRRNFTNFMKTSNVRESWSSRSFTNFVDKF